MQSQARPFSLEPFGVGRALVDFVSFADRLFELAPAPFSSSFDLPHGPSHFINCLQRGCNFNKAESEGRHVQGQSKGRYHPGPLGQGGAVVERCPQQVTTFDLPSRGVCALCQVVETFEGDTRAGRLLQHSSEPFMLYWFAQIPHSDDSRLTDPEHRLACAYRVNIDLYRDLQTDGPPSRCRHVRCSHIDLRLKPFHDLHCPGESKNGRDTQHNSHLNHQF
jgi:hypothetical protein